MGWKESDIGDHSGKVIVITGANSGIGFEAAKAMVNAGAHVVLACRDENRAADAVAKIEKSTPAGTTEVLQLDVSDLDSVRAGAELLLAKFDTIDALVNNAGIMATPRRASAQGFELQMATNHLGHFVLTAKLWPALLNADQARVVSLSSLAARGGYLNAQMNERLLVDPDPYSAFPVYSNTKQATLLFAQELDRRIAASNAEKPGVISVAVHPGVSSTNLFNRQLRDRHLTVAIPLVAGVGRVIFPSPKDAAHPTERALSDPDLVGGEFIGPSSLGQSRGAPIVMPVYSTGSDPATAQRLWELSEVVSETSFRV